MRSLLKHPRVEPLVSSALRARLVRESVRFFAREVSGRHGVCTYRLRVSGLRVVLEHNSPDVLTLDEVFYQRVYEPPPEVAAVLAGVPAPLRVVDIGANVGLAGVAMRARYPGARITAYEPDPRNAEMHRRAIAANGLAGDWQLHEAAAAATTGRLSFTTGRYTLSGPADPSDADATTVAALDVLPVLQAVDLLKIDAEGSEWELLADPRFARTSAVAIALEYHPEMCPGPDARSTAEGHLRSAGFEVMEVPTKAPAGYGSLWAWRMP
jgi:FkbM family methyltransferase